MDRLSTDVGTTELSDYGARLRRRWWLVVLGLLVGLAAGAALLSVQQKEYTSTTLVLVAPSATGGVAIDGSRTGGSINLDTEAQRVRSAQVGDAARSLLRTQEPVTTLLEDVAVTVPANTQVLAIAFAGTSPKGAQEGSHAFAQAYLTNRKDEQERQVEVTLAGLESQLKSAQDQLQDISDKIAALVADSPDRVYAEAQRNILINQVNDLTQRIAPLQSDTINPGQIITDAPLPRKASAPLPELDLGAGLLAGLLLGLLAAGLADRADRRLRRPEDVARLVGLPVVADLVHGKRASATLPDDEHAAAADRLRNALGGGTAAGLRSVQISDPGGRGASSGVALQLSRSLVRASRDATLVIASPVSLLPAWAGVDGRPGLVEVLRGEATLTEVRVELPELPGVSLLPPGRDPSQLEALLQSANMRTVLASLQSTSSGVVVETLGAGTSAGAQAVAAEVASVLLVAERGTTDAPTVQSAADGTTAMGATLAGVVLVPAVGKASRAASGPPPVRAATPPVRPAGEHAAGRERATASDYPSPR